MGLFDFNTQDLTSETKIPKYLETFSKNTLGQANETTSRDFPRARLTQPIAGFDSRQRNAADLVGNLSGGNLWRQPLDAARGIFADVADSPIQAPTPQANLMDRGDIRDVSPTMIQAPNVNTTTVNRGDIRNVDVGDVAAQKLRDTNLQPYMDPYVDNVVQETLRDLEHQYGKAQAGIESQFAGSNAYGGSRMAVAQSEGARNYGDVVGRTTANLYSGAYQNAQQAAMGDITNALQADMTNQQAQMAEQRYNQAADESVASLNARFENEMEGLRSRLDMTGQQSNQAAQMRADLAGQQYDASTAAQNASFENEMEALRARLGLQADIQSRGLEMAAGKALQSGVGIGQNLGYQDAGMLWDMGAQFQGQQQRKLDAEHAAKVAEWNYPLDMINARIAAARGLPYESKTVQETPSGNPWAQGLGLLATAGGAYNSFFG